MCFRGLETCRWTADAGGIGLCTVGKKMSTGLAVRFKVYVRLFKMPDTSNIRVWKREVAHSWDHV